MTLPVVIVDDELAGRRTLREMCAREADLEVIGEYGDPAEALQAIRARPPQILFLDVQMEPLTGLDIARSLEPAHLPAIVFVTAYDDYALQAFEVCAVDYLLKPFDQERFQRTLERIRSRHAPALADRHAVLERLLAQLDRGERPAQERPRLLAEFDGHLHVLDAERIEMVEADRNYVRIRVGRDTYHARSTLAQAEQALRHQRMLKVSRSCLVNVEHVREVSRTPRGDYILVLRGGATVTSSEGHRGRVRDYFAALRLGVP